MTEPLPCPHHEDAHYPDRIVDHWKKPAEQWMVMYCCPECAHTFSDIGDTEEEADERALKGWNERYIPTANRVIVGDTTKHYGCANCGNAVDEWDKWCRWCGVLFTDRYDCHFYRRDDGSWYCSQCGYELPQIEWETYDKNGGRDVPRLHCPNCGGKIVYD